MSSALAMNDSFIIRHKSQQTLEFLWNIASGRAVWDPRQSLSPFQAWRASWIPDGLSYIRPFSSLTHSSAELLLLKLHLSGAFHKTHLWASKTEPGFPSRSPPCLCWGTPVSVNTFWVPSFQGCHVKVPPMRTLMDLANPTCGLNLQSEYVPFARSLILI